MSENKAGETLPGLEAVKTLATNAGPLLAKLQDGLTTLKKEHELYEKLLVVCDAIVDGVITALPVNHGSIEEELAEFHTVSIPTGMFIALMNASKR